MNNRLIFLHLPKCGGTTFHHILERIYPPKDIFDIKVIDNVRLSTDEFISLPASERDKIKLLKGHQPFGLHEYFTDKSEYITFLRDPVERIISYYFFIKRRPDHYLYKRKLFNDNMSFHDFVTKVEADDLHNGQVRLISGMADKGELMLEKALENIEKHFSFVGTLEQFDESLIILQKMYNWPFPYYSSISNKTKGRPKVADFDTRTIEAIKGLNREDILLYKEVTKQLELKLKDESLLRQKLFWMRTLSSIDGTKKNMKRKVGKLIPAAQKKALKSILS